MEISNTMEENIIDDIVDITDNIRDTGELPYRYPEVFYMSDVDRVSYRCIGVDTLLARDDYSHHVSWCMLSKEWLNMLIDYIGKDKSCLEFYAGLGLMTKYLEDNGVNIKSVDDKSWFKAAYKVYRQPDYTDIKHSIKDYYINKKPLDYVICSFIPYEDKCEWVKYLKSKYPKCKIIFIGEPEGGCTASDEFFDRVIVDKKSEEFMDNINEVYPYWLGMHDEIMVFRLK